MAVAQESPVCIRVVNPATGKKESKQVDTAKFFKYDSIAEAIEHQGEAKCLELINVQTKTNELNRLRSIHRPGGIGKTAIRKKATELLTNDDWMRLVALDPSSRLAEMEKLIDNKMAEAEELLKAASGGDDEDDDADANS